MFRKNPVSNIPVDASIIFPQDTTVKFIQLLHGTRGYIYGKTIHMALRDGQYIKKQLVYTMGVKILQAVTLKSVLDYWTESTNKNDMLDSYELSVHYLTMWAASLKTTILADVTHIIKYCIENAEYNYELYVDWLSTLGMVPFYWRKNKVPFDVAAKCALHPFTSEMISDCVPFLTKIYENFASIRVCNFSNVCIYLKEAQFYAFLNDKLINLAVVKQPVLLDTEVIFCTPVQHLHYELRRFDQLRSHRKLCQLLNTNPVKVVTTGRDYVDKKRIMELLERQNKPLDAKSSIIKFLLNLSDSKSRIGLDDSIDAFMQELTPSIIDQQRMFPNRLVSSGVPVGRDVRDMFKKQIIKCLEQEIKQQATEIQTLREINDFQQGEICDLKVLATKYARDHPEYQPNLDIEDMQIALDSVAPRAHREVEILERKHIANSFFSQYVPDITHEESRLNKIFEQEYLRTFHLRKKFNYQGQDDYIMYSSETIDLVVIPYLTEIYPVDDIVVIPAELLHVTESEILSHIYDGSMIPKFINFIQANIDSFWGRADISTLNDDNPYQPSPNSSRRQQLSSNNDNDHPPTRDDDRYQFQYREGYMRGRYREHRQ
ncbi:portal protein [Elephant endotheliotropic herpesvirus 1A]|uniref:Portal protein n=84 Tax=Elephantid herpesvirus 1 TaxID=146015 RepID=E2IKY8_ELHV1|nr:capsid portal protein [Elephantid betaherpesvirus 1]ADK70814.1 U76 [Elephant endotheliotropic herpesvirus 1A]ADK70853.1 U76 [Elephant endotheliotropic herpesvirus 1A]AGE10068.1 capsid portal protein [Elephantid betaherpesvirus 1]AGG16112.1 portal protein [Elephant endotheliotropic herpesvirus 1A]QOE74738.1 portal protein [Elephant endotheliotropic herpesvirus 1A]